TPPGPQTKIESLFFSWVVSPSIRAIRESGKWAKSTTFLRSAGSCQRLFPKTRTETDREPELILRRLGQTPSEADFRGRICAFFLLAPDKGVDYDQESFRPCRLSGDAVGGACVLASLLRRVRSVEC